MTNLIRLRNLGIGYLILFSELLPAQSQDNPVRLTLRAISGLQYDQVRLRVPPGAWVELTLVNADEMAHNWIMTQPGEREEVVNLSLDMAQQGSTDYIPTSDKVVQSIPLLNPEEQYTLEFQAPEVEGVYPYVCTYPGHGAVMYGAMYVTADPLPPLATDEHVPPNRREETAPTAEQAPRHPYPDSLPTLYRTFMPDCGPAGIAVGLPGDISYCWDAGQCRLRYVWKGGFLDLTENWSGKGKERAEIVGTVFYREPTEFPIRLGEDKRIPDVKFLGYEMKDRYPTFKYRLDGVEVTERIVPAIEQTGVRRTLTFTNLHETLWFVRDRSSRQIYVNQGQWEESRYLRLSPEEAREFTITITENPEGASE